MRLCQCCGGLVSCVEVDEFWWEITMCGFGDCMLSMGCGGRRVWLLALFWEMLGVLFLGRGVMCYWCGFVM